MQTRNQIANAVSRMITKHDMCYAEISSKCRMIAGYANTGRALTILVDMAEYAERYRCNCGCGRWED